MRYCNFIRVCSKISVSHCFCILFQVHEQLNKILKGDGGPTELLRDEDALRSFGVRAPEVSRLVTEFEKGKVFI